MHFFRIITKKCTHTHTHIYIPINKENKQLYIYIYVLENNLNSVLIPMMENKISGYLLRCPRISIDSFINKFSTPSHEWNYKYKNHSIFHNIRALTLIFIEKMKKTSRNDFFPKRRIMSFQSFQRERERVSMREI